MAVSLFQEGVNPVEIEKLSLEFWVECSLLRVARKGGGEKSGLLTKSEWGQIETIYDHFVSIEAGQMLEQPANQRALNKILTQQKRVKNGKTDGPLKILRKPTLVLIASLLSDALDDIDVPATDKRHAITVGMLDQARRAIANGDKGRPVRDKEWTRTVFDHYHEYQKLDERVRECTKRLKSLEDEKAVAARKNRQLPAAEHEELAALESGEEKLRAKLTVLASTFRNRIRAKNLHRDNTWPRVGCLPDE